MYGDNCYARFFKSRFYELQCMIKVWVKWRNIFCLNTKPLERHSGKSSFYIVTSKESPINHNLETLKLKQDESKQSTMGKR
jgi:hypothetical protein